jgi:hypothetical protein
MPQEAEVRQWLHIRDNSTSSEFKSRHVAEARGRGANLNVAPPPVSSPAASATLSFRAA